MKIYSLLIFDVNKKLFFSKHNLDDISFFYRIFAKNTIESTAKNIINTNHIIEKDKLYKINEKVDDLDIIINSYYYDKFFVIITDKEYPQYLVYTLFDELKKNVLDQYIFTNLWFKYQNPKDIDNIQKIQSDLDDTKIIILDSLNKLAERGATIENIAMKTEHLEQETFKFEIESKKLNKCCIIL